MPRPRRRRRASRTSPTGRSCSPSSAQSGRGRGRGVEIFVGHLASSVGVVAHSVVIPGRAEGASPESRDAGTVPGPWIPGPLASLASRNDVRICGACCLCISGTLLRSRGAQAPEFCCGGPRLKKARGTARQGAHPVRLFTQACGPRGASRRAVSAISVPGAVTSGRKRSPRGPPIGAASAALRLRRVQPLKAGPRSGAGRLAGASRARGLRSRARGRRPEPHERCNRFASPHGVGRSGI